MNGVELKMVEGYREIILKTAEPANRRSLGEKNISVFKPRICIIYLFYAAKAQKQASFLGICRNELEIWFSGPEDGCHRRHRNRRQDDNSDIDSPHFDRGRH